MALVASRSVSSVSVASVTVGWLVRLRTGARATRLSRAALVWMARLAAEAASDASSAPSAEGSPSADMPRCFTGNYGQKYLALI